MNVTDISKLIKALIRPEGGNTAQLDEPIGVAIESAYKEVWEAHWWRRRVSEDDLTTVAAQSYIACPNDFSQGIALAREGENYGPIRLVSPIRFFQDHASPANDPTGRPKEATVIFHPDSDRYRLEMWPRPDSAYTLHLIYLREATMSELPELHGNVISAIIDAAKAKMNLIAESTATNSLDEAIEKEGLFVMAPGRMSLNALDDLNRTPTNRNLSHGPTWYYDIP